MSSNTLYCKYLQNMDGSGNHGGGRCRLTVIVLFAVLFLLTGPVCGLAQDETAENQAGPENSAGTEDAAGPLERLIYLPYRNLKEVFAKHGSTVFMPYAEYLKLWQQTRAVENQAVEAVITESHYTASVDQSLLRIKAELSVRVLGKPWVGVPVTFGRAAVGRLTADQDGQVLLRGTGDGTYTLLFGKTGEHKVTLELAAAITTSPDGRSAAFSVPPVGVTTFELAIPQTDQTVNIAPQMVALPVAAVAGQTRVKANLGSTTKISARWHPRTSQKPDMDLLASVSNLQKVSLRDGLVHTDAWLEYDFLRGEMSELAIAVPTGHRILGVTSSNSRIRGWKKVDEEHRQTVTVEFLNPVKERVTLEVHTEREFSDALIEVAGREASGRYLGIHSVDAVRESGQISVAVSSDLSLHFEQLLGLARIEDEQVEQRIRQSGAASFRFYSPNIRMAVLAKPVEPRLLVGSDYRFEFTDDELRLRADLKYTIERAGVFELSLELPDGLEVDQVNDAGGQLVREHYVEGDAPRILRIALHRRTAASSTLRLQIAAHVSFDDEFSADELSLPIPEPLNVEREQAQVRLIAEDALEVVTDQDLVEGAQPMPLVEGRLPGGRRVSAAWTFNRRPVDIPIRTVRRPTRLSVQIGTTANVREEIVEVSTRLTCNVQYAGVDTFRFAVPEAVSKGLQITSLEGGAAPAIKQKVPAEDADDGWVTWTVIMQRDVIGSHRFELTWDLKPEATGEESAARTLTATVQTIRMLGISDDDTEVDSPVPLADVMGEFVVEKDRALSVSASQLDDGLETIDVRELTLLPQSGALAYRYYVQSPVGLQVEATKYEIQKVVETVVMRSLVEVVARRELTAAYRCRYYLKSSERQRLQIDIPFGEETLLQGVFVNGREVSLERSRVQHEEEGWDSYFVNVTREQSSDEPFSLTLQMVTPVSGGDVPFNDWLLRRLMLRLPQIGGSDQSSVVWQQTQTIIWTPEDHHLLGNPDNFVNESQMDIEEALRLGGSRGRNRAEYVQASGGMTWNDWIGIEETGIFDFPTEGNAFRFSNLGGAQSIQVTAVNVSHYTWLFSGALVLVALLLRNVPWDQKILLLLVLAFCITLAGLSFPGWVPLIVSATKYGIYTLLAIWILNTVFARRGTASPNHTASGAVSLTTGSLTAVSQSAGRCPPAVVPPPGVFDDLRDRFRK